MYNVYFILCTVYCILMTASLLSKLANYKYFLLQVEAMMAGGPGSLGTLGRVCGPVEVGIYKILAQLPTLLNIVTVTNTSKY